MQKWVRLVTAIRTFEEAVDDYGGVHANLYDASE